MSNEIFEAMKKFFEWLGKLILSGLVSNSYWICLYICLGSLILYISGLKKAAKYISISFILYFFLQCIKGVINV